MQIVFAHYHLNPGGVTQVILSQIAALATLPQAERPQRIGVLYGARKDGWPEELPAESAAFDVQLISVPELDYDQGTSPASLQLAENVRQALAVHEFAPEETLLHIHNHSLGKNISWPGAIRQLAEAGYRILLQIHDFAEDFRPANYGRLSEAFGTHGPVELASQLYPQASSIHYATLTEKDALILHESGVASERLTVLSNPATEFPELPQQEAVADKVRQQLGIPADAKLVVYPVRGIRRKNVGELLLYSAISAEDTWHAITLAPRNPLEKISFDRWQALAKQLQLRTLFNISEHGKPTFFDTLAASDWLLTTSVAEGFGMVFLEAWLVGKQLVGRRIPGLTEEFEAAGLKLERLRDSLFVPLVWISDRHHLADALEWAYTHACDSFGVEPDEKEVAHARQLATGDSEGIDFALLPGKFQELIVVHAAENTNTARAEIERLNPSIVPADFNPAEDRNIIAANAEVTRTSYSFSKVGAKLRGAYQALADAPIGSLEHSAGGEAILHAFLKVERLHAIRFEE